MKCIFINMFPILISIISFGLFLINIYFSIKEKSHQNQIILIYKSIILAIIGTFNFIFFVIFKLFNPILITILLIIEIPILLLVIFYKDLDY